MSENSSPLAASAVTTIPTIQECVLRSFLFGCARRRLKLLFCIQEESKIPFHQLCLYETVTHELVRRFRRTTPLRFAWEPSNRARYATRFERTRRPIFDRRT